MKRQKKEAAAAPLPMTNEEILELLGPAIDRVEATLADMKGALKAQITRANSILADLQRRVSALEQRQGMGATKRIAKKGRAQSKRKEA